MTLPLTIAWLGNLIDMVATLILVAHGYHEANPIMRPLLQYPMLFVVVKLTIMTALVRFLWNNRADKHAKTLATLAALVYGCLSVYYIIFLSII